MSEDVGVDVESGLYRFDSEVLDLLRKSKAQQGYLYPVVKDQHGHIISGRHRKAVDKNWPELVINVDDELDRELKIIHYNVQRKPSQKETAGRLSHIAKILEKRGIAKPNICSAIAKLVPYSEQHIRRLLPSEYKHGEFAPRTFKPQNLNLWIFHKCDEGFGSDYPGRCPGQVVQNLLWLYTDEGDVVVDPMAGSGTTIDVCKLMNRLCIAFDLNPTRSDIKPNDIRKGIPLEDESANLMFLDPPYWRNKKGEYSKSESDLANLSLNDFFKTMEKVALEARRILREGKYCTLLMGTENREGRFIDLTFACYRIFIDAEFTPVERIVVNFGEASSINKLWISRAEKYKFLLRGYRDILVFRK